MPAWLPLRAPAALFPDVSSTIASTIPLVWSDQPDQMMEPRCVNVQEAKTHLSALLARVAAGERIVLARHGKPIAQLVPLDPSPRRQLGFLKGSVDEAFFDPLPDDELERWGA
jgi:prevent-host-death family protein